MSEPCRSQLIARLRSAQTAGDHPDAETLTAFGERTLSSQARRTVTDHLAGCAECRELVSLCAIEPARTSRPVPFASLAAAAAIVLMLAGTTSIVDNGIVSMKNQVRLLQAPQAPRVSYAEAELKQPGAGIAWRVRGSIVESSLDFGKNWRRAKFDRPFEAETVQYSGADVLVRSRAGELALSSDSGLHWTFLKTAKGR